METRGYVYISVVYFQDNESAEYYDILDGIGAEGAIEAMAQGDYGQETIENAVMNNDVYPSPLEEPVTGHKFYYSSEYVLSYNDKLQIDIELLKRVTVKEIHFLGLTLPWEK